MEKFTKPDKVPEVVTIRQGDIYQCRSMLEIFDNLYPALLKKTSKSFLIKSIILYLFGFFKVTEREELLTAISQKTNQDFTEAIEGLRLQIERLRITSYSELDNCMLVKRERAGSVLNSYHRVTDLYASDDLSRPPIEGGVPLGFYGSIHEIASDVPWAVDSEGEIDDKHLFQ